MKKFVVQTAARTEMIDITHIVKQYIIDERVSNGFIFVFVPHTTAGVTINEGADPAVQQDIISFLDKLIPINNSFFHLEGNSDAHIKASLIGASVTLLVEDNKLILGTWQHIFLFEADGPRSRKIFISQVPLVKQ